MRKHFSEAQIVSILKEFDAGIPASELCRKHQVSKGAFYNWKSKYAGMSVSELTRLKELEQENRKLKEMFANLSLEHQILKEVIEKNRTADRL